MNKLLIICGTTATGKTALALELAKKYSGDLLSADSRQIYKGVDIGVGKDTPKGFVPAADKESGVYYSNGHTNIWGYDLVSPFEEFSVSHYLAYANRKIMEIWDSGKLPIVVGGTGLYINGVVNGIETAGIPVNKKLREELSTHSAAKLFNTLTSISPKAKALNQSDRGNPRRLIRAIEIASFTGKLPKPKVLQAKVLWLGLSVDLDTLQEKIHSRVQWRYENGFLEEVRELLKKGVDWNNQIMSSTGYRQYREHVEGKVTAQEFLLSWKRAEFQYAKRQTTWFKKNKNINWFNPLRAADKKRMEEMVKKWYSSS
ncbi:tRNA (adenosine(37)-N6)-dimethylallyltransferase MiaA [Candidatus Microgenomates bacterium]|nr:MAG: tRNA (adenosine(37)-N6)-dimethylallyltransferase MiaA [Candidatus Microgenomates bacterium]